MAHDSSPPVSLSVAEREPLYPAAPPPPAPEVTASAADDPGRWMSNLRDSISCRTLGQIYMVGSHNAASYAITPSSGISPDAPPAIVKNAKGIKKNLTLRVASTWSVCQEMTVKAQLEWGARYLDLRLSVRSHDHGATFEVWISHGMYSVPLRHVVDDLVAFLDAAPAEEVIVVDIQHLHGFSSGAHHDTVLDILKPLVPRMAHRPLGMHSPLRDFWAANAQVLVTYCNNDVAARFDYLHQRSRVVDSCWHNKNCIRTLVPDIKQTLKDREDPGAHVASQDAAARLHVTQGIITPATHNIVKTVFAPWCCLSYKGIEDFAKKANDHVLRAWTEHDSGAHSPTTAADIDGRNVLMMDFIHLGRCPKTGMNGFELCMDLNRRLRSPSPVPAADTADTATAVAGDPALPPAAEPSDETTVSNRLKRCSGDPSESSAVSCGAPPAAPTPSRPTGSGSKEKTH